MKRSVLLLPFILAGCHIPGFYDEIQGELITRDPDSMRKFQRYCRSMDNTFLSIERVDHAGTWQFTCHKYPEDNPLREDHETHQD